MSISCTCDTDGDYDWYWTAAADFAPLATKRSRKCGSCEAKIKPGDDALLLECDRSPKNEIEERIYGDIVPMPNKYLCEECGGLYMAVSDLDMCWNIGSNIKEDVREWAEAQKYYAERARKAKEAGING